MSTEKKCSEGLMITVLSSVLKSEFFISQIKHLGQIINAKGWTPDPERTEAIKSMPVQIMRQNCKHSCV